MKNILIFLILFQSTFLLSAQRTYIPDDNFEQALIDLGLDDVLDDYVLTANISSEDFLYLYNLNISDLTGIEDFISLEGLNVGANNISSLNISNSPNLWLLDCSNNQLTTLDVGQNIPLKHLECRDNLLTSLDVSNNILLEAIYCGNNYISELDLRNNINLTSFSYDSYSSYPYMQALDYIDLRNGNNQNISYCSLSNNINLKCVFVDDANAPHPNWHMNHGAYVNNEAECDALSINEFDLINSVVLYPNPIKDILFIENTSFLNIQKINLHDVYGKQILSIRSGFDKVNFKNIVPGLYFIVIETEYSIITKKIIKK